MKLSDLFSTLRSILKMPIDFEYLLWGLFLFFAIMGTLFFVATIGIWIWHNPIVILYFIPVAIVVVILSKLVSYWHNNY